MSKLDRPEIPINLSATTPDKWVVVKIKPENEPDFHKVFASWYDEAWKINSGIKSVKQDEDYYYFYGYSGSCYKCHKEGYGIASSYSRMVYEKLENSVPKGTILLLKDKLDWEVELNN